MNIARVAGISALVLLPIAAVAATGPALDLIDSVLKCADVGASDARLACYDGLIPSFRAAKAAPPPPAPPPVAAAPPASATPAATPPVPPAEDRAWYDPSRLFGSNPTSQQTTPGQFGADQMAPPPPKPGEAPTSVDSITAEVTDYAFNPYGKVIVFLDNGQIWQQVSSDDEKAHFNKSAKNIVVIERGAVGSYQMSINGKAMAMKVKRIK